MSRTYRAFAALALSLALATAPAAVAVAAQPPQAAVEDQNDRLLRGIQTAQAQRTQAAVEQARALERQSEAATQPAAVEDQNDRLLRGIQTAQAERTQAAVERARAIERNVDLAPPVTIAPQPVPAATGGNVDPVAIALLALAGGVVGGIAAMAAWTAASRHRPSRVVAA
jgi:hypothetical protein